MTDSGKRDSAVPPSLKGAVCDECGAPVRRPGFDRKAWTPLFVGLAAVLALLIIGVLDSAFVRDRLGIGPATGKISAGGEAVAPVPGNLVPNFSLEQAGAGVPAGWRTSKWGTNSPSFQYLTVGRSGTRSVKVTMADHVDGDAKWVHERVAVVPGGDYRFTDYYQSNVATEVVVELHHTNGKATYESLPGASPSPVWRKYAGTFSVPADVTGVVVFHIIAKDGYLATDDYVVTPHKIEGFARGLLTLTFDDGWEGNVTSVIPRLEEYGFGSTQFFATKYVEGVDDSGVRRIHAAGHEIGSHSVNHPDLRKISDTEIDFELTHSKKYLEGITGTTIDTFATPFGAYDSHVIDKIREHGYAAHRSVDEGFNSKDNFDLFNVRVQNILLKTTPDEVRAWVDKAQRDGAWLVLVYHRVGTEKLGTYDSKVPDFEEHLRIFKQSGLPVVTFREALSEVRTQL